MEHFQRFLAVLTVLTGVSAKIVNLPPFDAAGLWDSYHAVAPEDAKYRRGAKEIVSDLSKARVFKAQKCFYTSQTGEASGKKREATQSGEASVGNDTCSQSKRHRFGDSTPAKCGDEVSSGNTDGEKHFTDLPTAIAIQIFDDYLVPTTHQLIVRSAGQSDSVCDYAASTGNIPLLNYLFNRFEKENLEADEARDKLFAAARKIGKSAIVQFLYYSCTVDVCSLDPTHAANMRQYYHQLEESEIETTSVIFDWQFRNLFVHFVLYNPVTENESKVHDRETFHRLSDFVKDKLIKMINETYTKLSAEDPEAEHQPPDLSLMDLAYMARMYWDGIEMPDLIPQILQSYTPDVISPTPSSQASIDYDCRTKSELHDSYNQLLVQCSQLAELQTLLETALETRKAKQMRIHAMFSAFVSAFESKFCAAQNSEVATMFVHKLEQMIHATLANGDTFNVETLEAKHINADDQFPEVLSPDFLLIDWALASEYIDAAVQNFIVSGNLGGLEIICDGSRDIIKRGTPGQLSSDEHFAFDEILLDVGQNWRLDTAGATHVIKISKWQVNTAASLGDLDMLRFFEDKFGLDMGYEAVRELPDHDLTTSPFASACHNGHHKIVDYFLSRLFEFGYVRSYGSDDDSIGPDHYGHSDAIGECLVKATVTGDTDMLRIFINRGVDLDHEIKMSVYPPLPLLAVQPPKVLKTKFQDSVYGPFKTVQEKHSVLKVLLREGRVNVDAPDPRGTCAIHVAAYWASVDAVRELCRARANPAFRGADHTHFAGDALTVALRGREDFPPNYCAPARIEVIRILVMEIIAWQMRRDRHRFGSRMLSAIVAAGFPVPVPVPAAAVPAAPAAPAVFTAAAFSTPAVSAAEAQAAQNAVVASTAVQQQIPIPMYRHRPTYQQQHTPRQLLHYPHHGSMHSGFAMQQAIAAAYESAGIQHVSHETMYRLCHANPDFATAGADFHVTLFKWAARNGKGSVMQYVQRAGFVTDQIIMETLREMGYEGSSNVRGLLAACQLMGFSAAGN